MGEDLRSFQDLDVWRLSCDLAEAVFRITGGFPTEDRYGLSSQLRRAVVSIAANIAEGAGRWGPQEFRHLLSIARGSLAETRTLLELSRRFGRVTAEVLAPLTADMDSIDKMLFVLHRNLGRSCR